MILKKGIGMIGTVRIKSVIRVCISSIAVFVTAMLQMCVFPYFRVFGCIPDALGALLICLALFEDERVSCILAVCGGFILQAAGTGGVSYYPLFYLIAVSVTMAISYGVFESRRISAVTSGAVCFIAEGLISCIMAGGTFAQAFIYTFAPQLLYSLACMIPAYGFCKLHGALFGTRRKINFEKYE